MTAGIQPDSVSPIVFFDGQCPMCSREIAHYRKLRGSDAIQWVDVHADDGGLEKYGLNKEAALARFHVLDAQGKWKTGAFGFIEMWHYLPRWRVLARIITALRLGAPLDWGYGHFARWRLSRQCKDGQCRVPGQ